MSPPRPGRPFILKFPTVDNIVDSMRKLQGTAMLAKIDVVRAFHTLQVDNINTFKFGLKWHNKHYLDIALVFDWVHGSA